MEFSEIVGDEDGKSSDWHTSDMPNDVKNALSLAFLDGFHNEVHRLHDELQREWEEAEDDDLPMEFSFGGVVSSVSLSISDLRTSREAFSKADEDRYHFLNQQNYGLVFRVG